MRTPDVTCICLTKNRRIFLRRAVEYFERAAERAAARGYVAELVIVDGSEHPEPVRSPAAYAVRSIHLPTDRPNPGAAHNAAVEAAAGRYVIQWDDDDWQSPNRIVRQVTHLEAMGPGARGIALTGRFYWYALAVRRGSRSNAWWTTARAAPGCTLAYHRATWERIPFREVNDGEDGYFLEDHYAAGTPIFDAQDPELVVYVRHNVNGSPLLATLNGHEDDATKEVRAIFGSDLAWYDEISEILPVLPGREPRARRAGGTTLGDVWAEKMGVATLAHRLPR